MSASTGSNTSTRAPVAAGTGMPALVMSATRPNVFSTTVLPPALGPVSTSAWLSPTVVCNLCDAVKVVTAVHNSRDSKYNRLVIYLLHAHVG
eukprot:8913-Heterococcus_DN1.PRE.1